MGDEKACKFSDPDTTFSILLSVTKDFVVQVEVSVQQSDSSERCQSREDEQGVENSAVPLILFMPSFHTKKVQHCVFRCSIQQFIKAIPFNHEIWAKLAAKEAMMRAPLLLNLI
jgi:hypothetical protein